MKRSKLNHKRAIAVLLTVCILITMVPILVNFQGKESIAAADTDEKKIAADISSSTGVEIEKILTLKNNGMTWNEILDYLKGKGGSNEGRAEMEELLTEDVLGEEEAEELLAAGFTTEEIQQANLFAERVQFQLQEIINSNDTKITTAEQNVPVTGEITTPEKEDLEVYTALAEKFNLKTIITLMLKLQASFGSMEQVMDEYLYSLQVDLDLEEYLIDSEAYLGKKKDKGIEIAHIRILTMSDIETGMIKAIQQKDVYNTANEASVTTINPSDNKELPVDNGPDSPLPKMKDVTPANPGEDILLEIQQINPLK